ncbi:LysM peptidoglycan-binding domain-containing protein [Aerococcus viridans]|jgi:LysM repeat protein|uniref:LysM peptidoglycan-binding domain-containing protein n=1 Tax=Aerococcus viridans TaxID=1377 RepID=UPI0037F30383
MKFWDKLTKKNQEHTEVETEQASDKDSSASSDQTPPTSDDFQNQGFGEFENLKNQKYTRTARNKKSNPDTISTTSKVIAFLLFVMIVVPFLLIAYMNNEDKVPEPESTEQVMISKTQNVESISKASVSASISASESVSESIVASESAVAASESESARLASEQESSSIAASVAESNAAVAASEAAAQSAAESASIAESQAAIAEEESASSESASESTGTYTVQAGDNLYRIAVNNGMTLDELLELNGLTQSSSIGPGTVLRVN